MKVNHHGSSHSTNQNWLNALKPTAYGCTVDTSHNTRFLSSAWEKTTPMATQIIPQCKDCLPVEVKYT